MKLSAPTKPVFLISLIIAIVTLLSVLNVINIPVVSQSEAWFALGAYLLLMLGNVLKGF